MEYAGLSRVIATMEKTIASHEEVLNKNGIGDLRVCVDELKDLLYGNDKVGAPGMISQLRCSEEETKKLSRQRDKLTWILFGIGLAMAAQTGTVLFLVEKAAKLLGGV